MEARITLTLFFYIVIDNYPVLIIPFINIYLKGLFPAEFKFSFQRADCIESPD